MVKADDDSFVVLGELEARLRVAWYEARGKERGGWGPLVYWGCEFYLFPFQRKEALIG